MSKRKSPDPTGDDKSLVDVRSALIITLSLLVWLGVGATSHLASLNVGMSLLAGGSAFGSSALWFNSVIRR